LAKYPVQTNNPDVVSRSGKGKDSAKPIELPVQQPIKFEFIVNLKAAKQIGLTIPPNVLVRADRVIKEAIELRHEA